MQTWRLIETIQDKGAMQMAIDEAILLARIQKKVPNTLRFYTWRPSCVTVGFFQSRKQEVDLCKAEKMGVDVVRRYTGGGAVFHENELTYSLTIPESEATKDISKSYEIICGGVVNGLKSLGIKAEFKPVNDILVKNKKISGNAQTRKEGIILQHGTILLDVDVKKIFSILKVPDEKIKDKLIKTVEERVTSLKNETTTKIDRAEIEKAFIQGFLETFKAKIKPGRLTPRELKQ